MAIKPLGIYIHVPFCRSKCEYCDFYSLGGSPVRIVICGVYVLCALIRLAWFNVDEEARQDFDTGRRKVYLGLPVTSAAGIFPCSSASAPCGIGRCISWGR